MRGPVTRRDFIRRLGTGSRRPISSRTGRSRQRLRALDQLSIQQLWEAAGLSQEAIDLLASVNGLGPELPTAVTEILREEVTELWSHRFDEIVGGMDRLPAAFVERLQAKPRLGCEVVAIEQDPPRLEPQPSTATARPSTVPRATSSSARSRSPC